MPVEAVCKSVDDAVDALADAIDAGGEVELGAWQLPLKVARLFPADVRVRVLPDGTVVSLAPRRDS